MKLTTQYQTIATGIIAIIIIGGGSFYGGMHYQKSKVSSFGSNRTGMMQGLGAYAGGNAGGGRTGRMMNSGFASGEVLAKDDKSITLKLKSGGSEIILLSDKTQVVKSDQGALTDLVIGQSLTINGTANQDGSLTAESIQIRPAASTQPIPTKTN